MSRLQSPLVRAALVVLPWILVVVLAAALVSRPTSTASQPSASPVAVAGSPSAPAATARPTRPPAAEPTPSPVVPTLAPCELPATLPAPVPPVATPVVEASGVAMLFSSNLYRQRADGSVAIRNHPTDDWAMGLWFVDAGSSEPRLLAAPEDGMVFPLGLAPAGDRAAVWWLPDRRHRGEPTCASGIYVLPTSGADGGRLIARGDWTVDPEAADWLNWTDPFGNSVPRSYRLPTASFSADGHFVALASGETIEIYGADDAVLYRRHAGECPAWAWAASDRTFVAGCDDLTNAWGAELGDLYMPDKLALPSPTVPKRFGLESDGTIGLTRDGDLLTVRFYGIAMGCPPSGCPVPGYSITRTNLTTLQSETRSAQVDFLLSDFGPHDVRLSGNGTWAYAEVDEERARIVNFETGAVRSPRRLEVIGESLDGRFLLGTRTGDDGRVVVLSLAGDAATERLATLGWPDGVTSADQSTPDPSFFAIGLSAFLGSS